MSLDPSEFGTADLEIAAVVHSRRQIKLKSKKKHIPIPTENYKMPDYGANLYGLGHPRKNKDAFGF